LKLLFSGDLGNAARPLLRLPAPPPQADLVVMETTYGDREHKPIGPSIAELYDGIAGAFARGGNVIIPTFALERAQELLYVFHQGQEQGRLAWISQSRTFFVGWAAVPAFCGCECGKQSEAAGATFAGWESADVRLRAMRVLDDAPWRAGRGETCFLLFTRRNALKMN
jgi:Cft2 family RNA processing exonuclease